MYHHVSLATCSLIPRYKLSAAGGSRPVRRRLR